MDAPEDIVYEVFSKLSTKQIFQATTVSKNLNQIVCDEYFHDLHSKNLPFILNPTTPLFIRDHRDANNNFFIILCLGQYHSRPKLYHIFLSNDFINRYWDKNSWHDNDFDIENSCNGLICIRSNDEQRKQPILICNPINHEYVIIPPCFAFGCSYCSLGIGYCIKTENYKVVAIANEKIMAYTLGLGSTWREVDSIHGYRPFTRPVCVNGSLYWIVADVSTVEWKRCLMSFNVEKEKVCKIMEIPSELNKWHCMRLRLTEIGKEIALVAFDETRVDVWMIEGFNAWVKRHSIVLPSLCTELETEYRITVMGLWENDEDVLGVLMKDAMTLYDTKRRCTYYQKSFDSPNDSKNWELFTGYKPSFISLRQIFS